MITLRCNHKCLYCHASAEHEENKKVDMTKSTIKKIIETIFDSPGKDARIEFQGGEPLLNWDVLTFAINYISELKLNSKKNVHISVVTNFTIMDKDKLDYFLTKGVGLCTSIDGTKEIHNENRVWNQGNSYQEVIKWFNKIRERVAVGRKNGDTKLRNPGALLTITRQALEKHQEVIDAYVDLGVRQIFLRPLNPIGYAKKAWGKIGYTTDEFMEFYKKALDYIVELNYKGVKFTDKFTLIKLRKMLLPSDPNFLDDRSPCGGGVGQIAYNYNGDVYTCDEGRMMAQEGDDVFKMGNVNTHSWNELIDSFTTKSICTFSCNSGYAGLANHVYKPYIGICPAYNYSLTGQMHPNFYESDYFKRHEAVLDYLFEKLQDEKYKKVFLNWVDLSNTIVN